MINLVICLYYSYLPCDVNEYLMALIMFFVETKGKKCVSVQ
jgi:hypothetical protein